MFRAEDDAHSALAQPAFKNVTAADSRAAVDCKDRRFVINRTNFYLVIVTVPAFWAFFHELGFGEPIFSARSLNRFELLSLARKILRFKFKLRTRGRTDLEEFNLEIRLLKSGNSDCALFIDIVGVRH